MGYETNLFIGSDSSFSDLSNSTYFQVYANIDMCKLGEVTEVYRLPWKNETPDIKKWYFFAPGGDGNKMITEDKYGVKFRPIPISDVIEALEKDITRSKYRRLVWALSLLKSIQENSTEELSVILFGY